MLVIRPQASSRGRALAHQLRHAGRVKATLVLLPGVAGYTDSWHRLMEAALAEDPSGLKVLGNAFCRAPISLQDTSYGRRLHDET